MLLHNVIEFSAIREHTADVELAIQHRRPTHTISQQIYGKLCYLSNCMTDCRSRVRKPFEKGYFTHKRELVIYGESLWWVTSLIFLPWSWLHKTSQLLSELKYFEEYIFKNSTNENDLSDCTDRLPIPRIKLLCIAISRMQLNKVRCTIRTR